MTITREDMTTLLNNTIMKKILIDGVHKMYEITPIEGYLLHDNRYDIYKNYNINGNGIGEPIVADRSVPACCTIEQFDTNYYNFYTEQIANTTNEEI